MISVHERAESGTVPSSASVADPEKEMTSPTAHVVPAVGVEIVGVGALFAPVAVVKFQVKSDANAFPAASFTPVEPPLTLAVYTVPASRLALGSSVASRVVASYDTVAGTDDPPCGTSVNVESVIEAASIGSENVT